MRFTVAKLHKELQRLIDQGHGRKRVFVDKTSFHHNCESDGVTILELAGLGIEIVPVSDGDGGTKFNKDGSESISTICVLAGGMRANHKGELLRRGIYDGFHNQ